MHGVFGLNKKKATDQNLESIIPVYLPFERF